MDPSTSLDPTAIYLVKLTFMVALYATYRGIRALGRYILKKVF